MQNAGVAQLVEQLICNQQVGGSNPFASSVASIWADAGVGEPGRTVNPLAYALEGSNPPPPTPPRVDLLHSVAEERFLFCPRE